MLREVAKTIPGVAPTYRLVRTAYRNLQATTDALLLRRRLPQLRVTEAPWLSEPYTRYLSEVSVDYMAASLELCHFLASLCESLQPQTILDLGSGFSSFVFRRYPVQVVSVDDDAEWLTKTEIFLKQCGVSTDHLIHLDEMDWTRRFDLVFHDIGVDPLRKQLLPNAVASTRLGGLLILDDAHFWGYNQLISNVARCPRYSLRHWTEDKYGRFGMAVLP